MNQYTLTGTDIGAIDQTFPCGNEHQRQCSRLTHVEGVWFGSDEPGIHGNVLGHSTLGTTDPAGHAEDFLAYGETLDRFAQFDNRTGEVKAEYCRQGLAGVSPRAGGNFGIEWIDPRGVNPDQYLALTRDRAIDLAHSQRGLSGFGDSGEHGVLHDGYLRLS